MSGNWKKRWFSDPEGSFSQGDQVNQKTLKRNHLITSFAFLILTVGTLCLYRFMQPAKATATPVTQAAFTSIIDADFTEKDNQSALSQQHAMLLKLTQSMSQVSSALSTLTEEVDKRIEDTYTRAAKETEARLQALHQQERQTATPSSTSTSSSQPKVPPVTAPKASSPQPVNSAETFGERSLPPRPASQTGDQAKAQEFRYRPQGSATTPNLAFDSHDFTWEASDMDIQPRSTASYVPSGTFVTARITGGGDANAGVLGQGDTIPLVLQTLNKGILPNGETSHLKDCTITASAYGEVSSSRGIVRTNRMSCIQDGGRILDVSIEGTAFNFGRNGVRGTTILKNGKIVEMAGISGILTGLGETGQALSQTTSTSALGSTQTVSGQNAALNLLGSAGSSVGAKLADYYIKLAELYHPIIEINPGTIVNIVFLKGFPLDPVLARREELRREEATAVAQSNRALDIVTTPPLNPIARELKQQGITATPTPFGQPSGGTQ
ncbi:IncF plasmid conjugative transfer pilus assembly protein TraB [Vibrio nigripulchritudo MADA3029]|uniref:TraB/VirB10 family protein n=2 Tax=Vibrio nigripulchritudo TaxID=28173 RepID=UPI0003B214A5|nr:TraB/VirB10 family protein [Vibrio nigripulchritudo]CCN50849.1 IncF plasmid conjugative transfer pilus assembly protein TraB [Vibrio nigripulchritudo MADA3020]CCN56707.1 IncF plasmid conjugative transfer pilus assembly protein TraB [Vibrio nigripulchritudo MADA3021]CCN62564.1 IncF plasmid conjugative transfer pilus assembly protein TraB [Vibrio nigripulchritudo MADA3029]BDU41066.1 conjugal transfer protein TraB [Vibrio nigripulchritudo]BDU46807.1 conjugal transfer protein TraB [Vibrio nigri